MIGIVTGFAVIALAILVGWIAARTGVVGPEARPVLARLNFSVLSPFLLFSVLATADVHALFSALLPVSAIAAVAMMLVSGVVSLAIWRRRVPEALIAALAAGYVNGNNFGIPIAVYMLGDAAHAAPVVLLQLIVFAPIALGVLGVTVDGRTSLPAIVRGTIGNPIIIGSLLGVAVSVAGIRLPAAVLDPIAFVGQAAVPLMLIAFGISLHGQRVFAAGSHRRDVVLASVLKSVLMPVAAWAVARFAFGLDAHEVFAVTVLAALPTAQNVFVYAQRFETAEVVARDTVFVTTAAAAPVLVVVALLLGT